MAPLFIIIYFSEWKMTKRGEILVSKFELQPVLAKQAAGLCKLGDYLSSGIALEQ